MADASGQGPAERRLEALRDRLRVTYGTVPRGVQERLAVAEAFGRLPVEEAFLTLRHIVLHESPLGDRVQQLVHFGQLLALGRDSAARLHARGALHAGARLADLVGVAETALITSGAPGYALGMEIVAELRDSGDGDSGDGDSGDRDSGDAGSGDGGSGRVESGGVDAGHLDHGEAGSVRG
ncbi:carboxymuconolactone decarboxylase family protein [Streptacidiphilus sp. 4-A2]|nr:carboxymuconolactone decarboxylase family protein [Streptacidiphilus sp. 4-A2]